MKTEYKDLKIKIKNAKSIGNFFTKDDVDVLLQLVDNHSLRMHMNEVVEASKKMNNNLELKEYTPERTERQWIKGI
jgi:hypothetical protein